MQVAPFVQVLQRDLTDVAVAMDQEESRIVKRIVAALGSSAHLRILEAVSAAAHELTPQLPAGRVEVRLVGSDPTLVYVEPEPLPKLAAGTEDGLSSRVTLRLPEALKAAIERTAARQGHSINTWIVRALDRAVSQGPKRGGSRLVGYARG
jgi:hypothetical protein